MKNNVFLFLFLCLSISGLSQQNITWDDLAKVRYEEKYYADYDALFLYPNFSSSVKALHGKRISITGYFLDVDPQGKMHVLSKGPMSSCFFCGAAGPETAIELQFQTKPSFQTDDIVTVTGTLKLNSKDVEHFNYILTDLKARMAD